jgi:hypothetical protein
MANKKVAVFGIYSTRTAVESATHSLVTAGFATSDISVLLPESLGGPKDMGTEKSTKAPEGAAAGVTTWRRNRWNARAAGGRRAVGYPWPRPVHRGRANDGRPGGTGRRRSSGWSNRRSSGYGNPGIRSKAIRRSLAEGRNSSVRTL